MPHKLLKKASNKLPKCLTSYKLLKCPANKLSEFRGLSFVLMELIKDLQTYVRRIGLYNENYSMLRHMYIHDNDDIYVVTYCMYK